MIRSQCQRNPLHILVSRIPLIWMLLCATPWPLAVAEQEETMAWTLTSSAFREGERIPRQYTCEGADDSPPMSWTVPPTGTKSLALVMDDPDAPVGVWVHWVVYNLPPETRALSEHVPTETELADGTLQGLNVFRKIGYGGPSPPPGPAHRYVFTLYALDTALTLPARASKTQLEQHMNGHLLGQAQVIGRYQR